MKTIEICDIQVDQIHLIQILWEENKRYHEKISTYFSYLYQQLDFEDRMRKFRELDQDLLKISLCKEDGVIVGYCLSTRNSGCGEVESIHVKASKRGNGYGKKLIETHLKWMNEQCCSSIGVNVSYENVETIEFYKKFGFFPNTLYMEQRSTI